MANIKPSEISDIIKKELEELQFTSEFKEVGSVLEVGDGIARIYGLDKVQANEMVKFENGVTGIVLNLEEDNIGVVLLGSDVDISEGDKVHRMNKIASINVSESLLGRVINTLGEPIDGKGNIEGDTYEMPL